MNLICCVIVLPSIGIGALSAREAEGRTNLSAGEKVIISFLFSLCACYYYIVIDFLFGVCHLFTSGRDAFLP